jgi:hypothetical protein
MPESSIKHKDIFMHTTFVLPNGKVMLSWDKHSIMKAYKGVEMYLHEFVTMAVDGSGWSAGQLCAPAALLLGRGL